MLGFIDVASWIWCYSKEEAGMKTAKLRDEKEVLDRQQRADIDAQKNLEENLQQLENRKHELESQEKQMQTRLKKILDAVKKHDEELKRVKEEQREMKNKLRRSRLVRLSYDTCCWIPGLISLFNRLWSYGSASNCICIYLLFM